MECEYRTEEQDGKYIKIGRCGKKVTKPFKVFDTGINMGVPGLGNAQFSNARCNKHYGKKNDPIKGLDLDIDRIVEKYGKTAIPKGDGYVMEREV